jgi:hypothetical protein
MTTRYYSSIAQDTTISVPILSGTTTVTVAATTGWPLTYPFSLALDYGTALEEIVDVTNVTGLTATIIRGVDSTTAVGHGAAAVVRHVIIARDIRDSNTHINTLNGAGAHGIVDVQGYTTTVTSASPVTLTAASTSTQIFTGTLAQTVVLPVTSTLTLGQTFKIYNKVSASMTINASDGSGVLTGTNRYMTVTITCISTSVTTNAGWSLTYDGAWIKAGNGGQLIYGDQPDIFLPNIIDITDPTKKLGFSTSGNTTGVTGILATTFTTAKTLTLPNATDTLIGKATTDTLTNKTLTSPVVNTPTGIVKGDVGLGSVDNTSNATERAATATLTNKDLSSPTNIFPAQIVAGKNAILNSDFSIWQRGVSGTANSASAGAGYNADRFQNQSGNAITVSRQPTSDTTNLPSIRYCARVQRNAGQTSTGPVYHAQTLETANTIPLVGKAVTLSFWARAGANFSSAGGVLTVYSAFGTGTDENLLVGFTGASHFLDSTPTLTSTWQRFTVSGTLSASATEAGVGFYYVPVGTAGANDYFEITGVMLELGSVATTFSRCGASIGGELQLCRRYLPATLVDEIMGYAYGANNAVYGVQFDTPARVAPTGITVSGTFTAYALNAGSSVTPVFNHSTINNADVLVTSGLTITAGQGSRMGGGGLILWTGCEL